MHSNKTNPELTRGHSSKKPGVDSGGPVEKVPKRRKEKKQTVFAQEAMRDGVLSGVRHNMRPPIEDEERSRKRDEKDKQGHQERNIEGALSLAGRAMPRPSC